MVCESMPDEAEALVVVGKQRTKYKIKINCNCSIKMLDERLQDLMVNQFSREHESSEFIPPQNFMIKMCNIDLDGIDSDGCVSHTDDLLVFDWNMDLKTLKAKLKFDNVNCYEYVFYIQQLPDDSLLKVLNEKRNTDSVIERMLDEHNLKNCEKTNCANDENDKLNDVDIKNNDATSDDTNKKDIFCTAFPEYSVKKQDLSSNDSDDKEPLTTKFIFPREDRVPRGLVNQAMTCYLNSLLQALYMTPEFRNALYKWEYVESPDNDETMSIPFQLQKLFLNLQTSEKSSVETTSLTKSFGWDSSEAWQQHDIQELCRVMFDALEQKFKNTEQANLINQLYEGKMIDYVKCLECNTEKTREDTFLDIPLPVRPFNSNVAYNSIEDALKAFVKYELLEGNNQYHCEKCNKKCDAHKGLKFNKFPYLVTLHLKRFDFDCHNFHRIKLNDKVTFPETLDLNPFIDLADSLSGQENNCQENNIKMDNGVSPDECSPCDENTVENIHGNEEPNDDKGIDETNDNCVVAEPKGPYVYELFAIMIHSGSASGGHYYAYIKNFTTQEWFCYNDQSVSRITNEDIKKTYGGGPARTTYYSSAYNTSTNAYMLMYRQIDPKINAVPMQKEDFPDHIKKLLPRLKEENSMNSHRICNSVIVFWKCLKTNEMTGTTVSCRKSTTWSDVLAQAKVDFGDKNLQVHPSLIKIYEFDLSTKSKVSSVLNHQSLVNPNISTVIIELSTPQDSMKCELSIIKFDVDAERAVGPIEKKPINKKMTIGELKMQLAESNWSWNPTEMQIAKKSNKDFETLKDDVVLSQLSWDLKLYVGNKLDPNPSTEFFNSKFCELCRTYSKLNYVQVRVPIINEEILAAFGIPSLNETSFPTQNTETGCTEDSNDLAQESKVPLKETDVVSSVPSSTLQLTEIDDRNTPEQSNSEDSSLSDSDRTLIAEPAENNEDEDEELQVFQRDEEKDEESDNVTIGLWISSQVSNIEGKLKKYLEPFIGVSTEYFQLKNICSAEAYPAQYSAYSVNLERKLRDDEMKLKIINLFDLFAVESTCDRKKFEVILERSARVRQLKEIIIRLMNFKHSTGYNWCDLWVINNQEDNRDTYMFEAKPLLYYRRKRGFDRKTIEIAMCPLRTRISEVKSLYHIEENVPVFVRRFYPSYKKYGNVETVMVHPSMKNFVEEVSRKTRIPQEYLLFINFSSLEQEFRSSGLTFSKNVNPWTELLLKSKDYARWSTTVPILPSIEDVIIYRNSREKYSSDMNREEHEICQDRLKMRKNYREYHTDNLLTVKDTDRELRIRSGIRSSMSRPEKGIKIQVSPNK